MNEKRQKQLIDYLHQRTESELAHLQGKHTTLHKLTFDQKKQAYEFPFFASPTMVVMKNSRFMETPPHYHSCIEINYQFSGTCLQKIDGQDVLLKRGDMTLIDSNTVHSLGDQKENDILVNLLIDKKYFVDNFLSMLKTDNILTTFLYNALKENDSQMNYLVFDTSQNDRLQSTMSEILYESFFPSAYHDDLINSMFHTLMLDMTNELNTNIICSKLGKSNMIIVSALKYIESNFLTCSLEETASVIGVNPSYLSSIMKKNVGKSFKELLTEKKMTLIAEEIRSNDIPIDTIAYKYGYENLTNFYQKFRNYYGCSPKEYRKR
ncbi:MAG: helix-turn-helix domain-containing protein [Erysipelotrichaceae bacterium]|nr:helix-turn-helix domain-containing protein [Erysipelotrichaceae bacterium]